MRIFALLSIVLCLGFFSCKSSQTTTVHKEEKFILGGQKWKLTTFRGKEAGTNDIESQITILFNEEAKTVSGYSGCNQYFGNINLRDNNQIQMSQIGSTKRACPQANMQAENSFLQTLPKITSYKVSRTELELLQGERVIYTFEKVD